MKLFMIDQHVKHNGILLEDVERLEALYNNLCRLAHWR